MSKKINIYHWLILVTGSLLIPIMYIYEIANIINPFYLNGKQFLSFFGLLTATSAITGIIWMRIVQRQGATNDGSVVKQLLLQPQHCVVLVLIIGFTRLLQGISNHKPVGYLILLLFLNYGLFLMIKFCKKLS